MYQRMKQIPHIFFLFLYFTLSFLLSLYFLYLQSAKILLVHPKDEIIQVLTIFSFSQFCDSNLGLFSIAPCNLLGLFLVLVLCFFSFFLQLSRFQLSQQQQLSLIKAIVTYFVCERKSDNYKESNIEIKVRTNVQNRY